MKYKRGEVINYCKEIRKNNNGCSNCGIESLCILIDKGIPSYTNCQYWYDERIEEAYRIIQKEKNIEHLSDINFDFLTEDKLSNFSSEEIIYNLQMLNNCVRKLENELFEYEEDRREQLL